MTIDQEGEKGFPSLRNLRKQSEKAGGKKKQLHPTAAGFEWREDIKIKGM